MENLKNFEEFINEGFLNEALDSVTLWGDYEEDGEGIEKIITIPYDEWTSYIGEHGVTGKNFEELFDMVEKYLTEKKIDISKYLNFGISTDNEKPSWF